MIGLIGRKVSVRDNKDKPAWKAEIVSEAVCNSEEDWFVLVLSDGGISPVDVYYLTVED